MFLYKFGFLLVLLQFLFLDLTHSQLFWLSRWNEKKNIYFKSKHCSIIGRDAKQIQYSIVLTCLIKETDKEIIEETKRQKKENKSVEQYIQNLTGGHTVGTLEKIIDGLNKYVDIGVTHFIIHFIGLDEKALQLFDSKVIQKLWALL